MNWTPQDIIELAKAVLIPSLSFIAALFVLHLFQKEIKYFLSKLTKAEGELENGRFKIGLHSEQNNEHGNKEPYAQSSPQEASDNLTSTDIHSDADIEKFFIDIPKTIQDEGINPAKNKFESFLKHFDGDRKKSLQIKTLFFLSLFLDGNYKDTFKDFQKLYDTHTDSESRFIIIEAWSFCYLKLKLYKESEDIITDSLANITDELIKTKLICLLSASISSSGDHDRARKTLKERLETQKSNYERALLYSALSSAEYNAKNKVMGALCLGKKADCIPEDLSALFDAAYQQSQVDINSISLFNYSRLISANPSHEMALNNIGVTAGSLNLKTKAVEFQTRASRLNTSLAYANLGYALLNAGFAEEAKSMAEKGLALTPSHENNHSLITSIKKQSTEENELWDKYIQESEKYKKLTDKYIDAYYSHQEDPQIFAGRWQNKDGLEFSVTVDDSKLKASWETHEHVTDGFGLPPYSSNKNSEHTITTKWSITGCISNNSAIVDLTSSGNYQTLLTGTRRDKTNLFSCIDNTTGEWVVFNTDIKEPFIDIYKRAPQALLPTT